MNNEEKILEILVQMQKNYDQMQGNYNRIQGSIDQMQGNYNHMQGSIEQMNKRLDSIDTRLGNVENEVVKTNLKIEQDIEPKINLLFDGQVTHTETLHRIEAQVNTLADIQEQHDVAIRAFRK